MIRNLILIVLLTLVNRNSFAQEALSDSTLANKLFTPFRPTSAPTVNGSTLTLINQPIFRVTTFGLRPIC